MKNLAIVIPAYKSNFFEKALQCFANQSNNNFTLYIGDDDSPENLESIAKKFSNILDISFIKFQNNIGSKNLVLQWKRCVDLTENEEWIWLFSDDDIIDDKAVENFYSIIEKNKNRFDVYRFHTNTIDSEGNVTGESPVGPAEEKSEEMAFNLLYGKRGNSMPDHIFSRSVYEKSGGFVFTEYAQGADWATSILFSKEKGMCIIPHSVMYWRYSGINISSVAFRNTSEMLNGHLQFIEWVLEHFKYLQNSQYTISYEMIKQAADFNLRNIIKLHYKSISGKNILRAYSTYRFKFGLSRFEAIKKVSSIKEDTSITYYNFVHFLNSMRAK